MRCNPDCANEQAPTHSSDNGHRCGSFTVGRGLICSFSGTVERAAVATQLLASHARYRTTSGSGEQLGYCLFRDCFGNYYSQDLEQEDLNTVAVGFNKPAKADKDYSRSPECRRLHVKE